MCIISWNSYAAYRSIFASLAAYLPAVDTRSCQRNHGACSETKATFVVSRGLGVCLEINTSLFVSVFAELKFVEWCEGQTPVSSSLPLHPNHLLCLPHPLAGVSQSRLKCTKSWKLPDSICCFTADKDTDTDTGGGCVEWRKKAGDGGRVEEGQGRQLMALLVTSCGYC